MSDDVSRAPTRKGLEFLGAVAGGLVHEIRNPLSTMNVTLQLLQEDFPPDAEDGRGQRTARRLKSLLGEVSRLEEILDDFLRYAGIRRLNLSQVDLNRVLEEVTGFMMPECARAGIDLAFYPDRSLPIMRVDERLVKQAVLNLLLNAVQAMEGMEADEGRGDMQLIVRTRLVGDDARVDVIDTGPGIPAHVRAKVWEVYYSRKRTGSGLGLPTARRIAEEHGGSLELESEEGKGTNFILRLPLAGPPVVESDA
ncbi:MAG: ATP-binding protein [Planctomycetota bacterium]|nr:ATP-binding protein [Planctomycetota bacterium]